MLDLLGKEPGGRISTHEGPHSEVVDERAGNLGAANGVTEAVARDGQGNDRCGHLMRPSFRRRALSAWISASIGSAAGAEPLGVCGPSSPKTRCQTTGSSR